MRKIVVIALVIAWSWSAAAQQHVNQKKGFNAENVYSVHDIDVVNAFNGNLTVSIPIGPQYPISDGFSYGLVLHANSNLWDSVLDWDDHDYNPSVHGGPATEVDDCDELDGVTVAVPHRRANAGIGWILTLGRLFHPSDPTSGGAWVYESPDGADHSFAETLHQPPSGEPSGADGVMYTRDGTFLRMRFVNASTIEIDFPDGAVHTFTAPTGNFSAWMPTDIRNRFSANWLHIDYNQPPTIAGGRDWVLTDNHGRTHRVIFESKPFNGGQRLMVKTVDLLAYGTDKDGNVTEKRALYQFNYTQRATARTDWSERCTPYTGLVTIQTLDSIDFPDDPSTATEGTTRYRFGYRTSTAAHDANGLLLHAILPTGAMIKWTWSLYHKPNESALSTTPYLQGSWGVEKRELFATSTSATPFATWTYNDTMDDNYLDEGNGDADVYPREMTNTITDPLGNATVNYFSVSGAENPGIWDPADYGRPFTRYHSQTQQPSGQKVWLSSVTYPAGATINSSQPLQNALKATYVRYEKDAGLANWRVASSRVVSPRTSGGFDFVDTDHTNYDGLGHYRTTKVSGSFGNAAKTTTTNYNPTMGAFPSATFAFPTSFKWLLNTFDFVEITQGTATSRTDFCFDPPSATATGFLHRKRVRRDIVVGGVPQPRRDLLTMFEDTDADGSVDIERYAGGDATPLSSNSFNTCSDPATGAYTINHADSYGVRSSSQHAGSNFKSLDLTIDPTGVPSTSRDVSGTLATRYVYNPMGQLREVRPPNEAWTEYTYRIDPDLAPFATVTVKQKSLAGSTLTEARHYYDSLGRLVQQRTWMGAMATLPWSASTLTYDLLGRKTHTSTAAGVASGDWGSVTPPGATETKFDALGRAFKIIQPDGSATDIAYNGASALARTAKILTTATVSNNVTTKETFDVLGRLESVTEDAEHRLDTQGVATPGAAFQTLYEYDEGDRLAKVLSGVQTRTFDYDGAGFLRSEDHPENDAITYEYDAAGHATKRTTTGSALRYVYDSAERLQTVFHTANGGAEKTLKDYAFGSTGIDRGRMTAATRHNDHTDLGGDVIVTETFAYHATTGRLSAKTTAVSVPGNPTRSFTDSYTYDQLGATATITYPGCSGCTGLTPQPRTVESLRANGYLQGVTGYASNFLYHPNGMWAQFSRPKADGTGVQSTDVQTVAANGMPRPASRSLSGYCDTFKITVPPVAAKTVAQGADADLSVTAPGATTYQWYANDTLIAGQTTSTLHVPVTQTTSYWVRVGNGTCTVDSSVSKITVAGDPPPAPLTTTATKASSTSVLISWTKPAGAVIDSYKIQRCTANCTGAGNWIDAGTTAAMTFTDTGRATNSAFAYRVFSVTSGTQSASAGPSDFATTFVFTNDPVVAGGTLLAVHVNQLRSAVNALRSVAGLASYNFTGTLTTGVTIKALDLTELHSAVNPARTAFGAAAVTPSQSMPQSGGVIRASHINDLRGGVQ